MTLWLLQQDAFAELQSRSLASSITADDITAFRDRFPNQSERVSRILALNGKTGTLTIQGVLTRSPDLFAQLFGGGNTTYGDIVAALETAKISGVTSLDVVIDSPGGSVSGMHSAMEALASCGMKTRGIVRSMAASAAYGLISQCDSIVAEDRSSRIGSVGIVQTMRVDDSVVQITSENAPNKRPDPMTDEGRAVIQAELNEIEALFIEAIASGRKVDTDKVKSDFGRGGTMLAEKALKAGMIDAIGVNSPVSQNANKTDQKPTGASAMNLTELKAQHPDLVQAIVAEERDRVNGHLTMAEQAGDLSLAAEAIKNGDGMTAVAIATYSAKIAANAARASRSADAADLPVIEGKGEAAQIKADDDANADFEALLDAALGGE